MIADKGNSRLHVRNWGNSGDEGCGMRNGLWDAGSAECRVCSLLMWACKSFPSLPRCFAVSCCTPSKKQNGHEELMNFKPTQKKLRFLAQTCAACQERNLCTANAARKVRRQASDTNGSMRACEVGTREWGTGNGERGVQASGNRRVVINCEQARTSGEARTGRGRRDLTSIIFSSLWPKQKPH